MNVPQRKPRDKEKIRQQYLANLQLENSNNTLNLNASKMYRATGASSQVATVMTGAEKLAGLEGLKQIGADFLVSSRFANPLSAKEAVDKMTPDEVKFLNEYNVFIGGNFKGRNVPSTVIVNYIRKLKKTLEETDGVDYGIQQSRGAGILLTGSGELYSSADMDEVSRHMVAYGLPEGAIHQVLDLMNKINRQCLKGDQLQKAQQEGPEHLALAQKANSQYRENTPTVDDLVEMADSGDAVGMITALQGAGTMSDIMAVLGVEATEGPVARGVPLDEGSGVESASMADQALDRAEWVQQQALELQNLGPELGRQAVKDLALEMGMEIKSPEQVIMALEAKYDRGAPAFVSGSAPSAPIPGGGGGAGEPATSPDLTKTSASSAFSGPAEGLPPLPSGSEKDPLEGLIAEVNKAGETIQQNLGASPDEIQKMREVEVAIEHFHHYCKVQGYEGIRPDDLVRKMKLSGLNEPVERGMLNYIEKLAENTEPYIMGQKPSKPPVVGAVFPKAPPSSRASEASYGRQSGSEASYGMQGVGLVGKGIGRRTQYEKPKPYKQFGRHLIHRHKLDDGILMIKYPSGARHPEMPTQKISEDLTKVFKEMADGKMPQYHHFQGLGMKDKELLHKVVRHTQFKDMEVPPPNKEALDKEMDRFDILRGELEAGNDNKEIVKEFKVMLMKFMRQGRIPKVQVNEIMEHLLLMGH